MLRKLAADEMGPMLPYLALVGVVFGANLLPAFGPPTWSLLVFFRLHSHIPAVPLVLIGALAAASGRMVLAFGSRRFRDRLSSERLKSLAAARDALAGGRKRAIAGLGLFALSPVPSAQLFVAAGLVAVPIVPLTAAFFTGRLVSYSIYVTAASAVKHSLGSAITGAFTSPLGIALQIVMLAGLVALMRVDWAKLLTRKTAGSVTEQPEEASGGRTERAGGSATSAPRPRLSGSGRGHHGVRRR